MQSVHRSILAGLASVLLSSAGAFAADLYGGSIKDGGYQPTMTAHPAQIYLRGDFSWSSNDFGNVTEDPNYTVGNTTVGRSQAWGGGIGYYFSPNVRGDLTLDWANKSAISGSMTNSIGNAQGQFGVRHMVGLANLYYDFDTRTRFTPYLGVGLGFARNTTTAGDGSAVCNTCGFPQATATFTTDGASKTNAAGALMAGFSAKIGDRWNLDAGYRFLYTGNAKTSDVAVTYADGSTTRIPSLNANDLYAHQFRVGLRMDVR